MDTQIYTEHFFGSTKLQIVQLNECKEKNFSSCRMHMHDADVTTSHILLIGLLIHRKFPKPELLLTGVFSHFF